MPAGHLPAIFVSSTCYDLKQLRADLRDFIKKLGCEPVLSEFDSFPVNPDVGAVENCLEAVRKQADIFVLIVGGRYGSSTDTGKSVTNLEYLQARTKGIPIYVFVDGNIMPLLPVWKQNSDANFNGIVDSPKLFEFIGALNY